MTIITVIREFNFLDRSPTTIEDNYRKENRVTVKDDVILQRIQQHLTEAENDDEVRISLPDA